MNGPLAASITSENDHIGLIYLHFDNSNPAGKEYHCDFSPQEGGKVRNKPYRQRPTQTVCQSGLADENKIFMAAFISKVADNVTFIPYGFGDTSKSLVFNSDSGEYIPLPISMGLTCASFILEIFRSRRLTLVNVDNWPFRADDVEFQRSILSEIDISEEERIRRMAKIGSLRVRPIEVFAAFACDESKIPLDFDQITVRVNQL